MRRLARRAHQLRATVTPDLGVRAPGASRSLRGKRFRVGGDVSPVSRDLRSTDWRLSKTCSVLVDIRMNDDNALFSLEKWTSKTWAQHVVRSNDNVVYTIFKYMNVDNRIWLARDFRVGIV